MRYIVNLKFNGPASLTIGKYKFRKGFPFYTNDPEILKVVKKCSYIEISEEEVEEEGPEEEVVEEKPKSKKPAKKKVKRTKS